MFERDTAKGTKHKISANIISEKSEKEISIINVTASYSLILK